ncbi:oligopeptide/dipeptide ABC transporter ATP-binding protein [Neorhizobium galegae]|uniref:ABC transporter ATP-binding protein n=1 Tax=Neorhizobium galegae TaxID=399 RepID=UPI00277ECF8D|nr:ABC transporter ATP-binding protein [Neorhizobium galegae]MDQ0138099.1 oligopeptide/dipeptide ABC transporter ATP-binding protein [Neorhizobium galegae]
MEKPLLNVRDLRVAFPTPTGYVEAVRGVNFSLARSEVMSLVGESGSGKSITMRAVMGLLPPTALVTGSVKFDGRELLGVPESEMRRVRGAKMSMVFQDPLTALNPVLTAGEQVVEAIRIHHPEVSSKTAREMAIELFRSVAIPYAEKRVDQYPHEFSGGMRQRVVIAIAIANRPDVIIADEPTTALDVTVQAQVLELLRDLCDKNRTGLVLITHDLGVVAGMAENVSVMYAGSIVEQAPVDELFEGARHPYTRGLLGALPQITGEISRLNDIGGTPPTAATIPVGCAFNPRCVFADELCREVKPELRSFNGGEVACHYAHTLPAHELQGEFA